MEENSLNNQRVSLKTLILTCTVVFVFLLGFSFSVQAYAFRQQELNSPVSQYLRENYGVNSLEEYEAKLEQEAWLNYSRRMETLANQYPELNFSEWRNPDVYRQVGTSTYQPQKITPQQPFYTAIFSEPVTALQIFSFSGLGLLGLVAVPPVRKNKRLKQALVLGIVVLCVFSIGYFVGLTAAQTGTINIEPASLSGDYSYLIETDGTYVWAKSGKTGEVVYGGQRNAGGVSGTNAVAVIQSALNALTSGRTWMEKVVLKGSFDITTSIRVPSYTYLDLTDAYLFLHASSDVPLIRNAGETSGNNEIVIMGGVLDGNGANQSGGYRASPASQVILFQNCSDVLVEGCRVKNAKWEGILFSSESRDFVVRKCITENCGYQGIAAEFGSHGFVLEGNICRSNQHDGILASWSTTGYAGSHNGLVIGNICYDNGAFGIAVESYPSTTPAHDISIIGNIVHDNQDGIAVRAGYNHKVIGNTAYSNTHEGIDFTYQDSSVPVYSVSCEDNIVHHNGHDGINLHHAYNFECNNNHCYFNGWHGIYGEQSQDGSIVGNVCYDNSQAGANTWWGISVDNAVHLNIVGNTCFDDQSSPTQGGGIGSAGGSYLFISGNKVWGMNNSIGLTVTNSIVRNNYGYVTENSGTATFSGNGSTKTFTIPHGLAGTPKSWRVEAGSADAEGDKYVTADATNLYVTFATAPPTGSNNVVLVWSAEM